MSPHYAYSERTGVKVMMLNAIFNYISSISWRSVLLVEETGVPRSVVNHWQTLSHNVVWNTPRLTGFQLTALVVICSNYTGSYKSNSKEITTTTDRKENTPMLLYVLFKKPIAFVSLSAVTWLIRCTFYSNLQFLSNVIILKTKVYLIHA